MMVYSSLQAEFMVTKYDGHIHRYGALVFGKLYIGPRYNGTWLYNNPKQYE